MRSTSCILIVAGIFLTHSGCRSDGSSEASPDDPIVEEVLEQEAITVTLAPESPLVMLTPTEYNNTIRDLYGFPNSLEAWPAAPPVAEEISPPEAESIGIFGGQVIVSPPWPRDFPEELGVHEFEGMADGQVPSAYGIEEFQKASLKLAPYSLVSPLFFTCDEWDLLPPDERKTCAWSSIERLAQRAWRRPLAEDEVAGLQEFWEDNWGGSTPEQAVVLTVAGLLQAPAFLFRVEEGEEAESIANGRPLTGWEMASKLSYFLWDSMPDQGLFVAAAQGRLNGVEGIEEQVRRMLEDPRARSMVTHFHHQWLQTGDVLGISPARSAYGPLYGVEPYPALDTTDDGLWPGIMGPVRHSLHVETSLFVEESVFDGPGTFEDLMTSRKGYRSNRTAPIYGDNVTLREGPTVSHSYSQVVFSQGSKATLILEPIEFPEGERGGILTLPSVMAIGGYAVHPAPIIRGVRLLERVVCQSFGAPPPGAEASVPPDALEVESTNRERTEAATADAVCAVCHGAINPPGFAFEHYDALGKFRVEDNGLPVDASGTAALWGGETLEFTDGIHLGAQLAESDRALGCYALHWLRYATGVDFAEGDDGVEALQDEFRGNDNIKDLLVAIAKSDVFRYRGVKGGAE